MARFTGSVGLVVGVANKRSIAWAIARAAAEEGASLVLTYQNDRLRENVVELADGLLEPPLVLPCDVTDDSQIDSLFAEIDARHRGLDFLVHGAAYAERADLDRPSVCRNSHRRPDQAVRCG